jgi:hypothetical protein
MTECAEQERLECPANQDFPEAAHSSRQIRTWKIEVVGFHQS